MHNSVQEKPVKDSRVFAQVSQKMRQQVANAYQGQGSLIDLKITNADQAIAYAREFGKELRYLDITGIVFSNRTKLEELIKNLPKLNTLVAQSSGLYKGAAQVIAASENMKNLTVLNLGNNKIGDEGAKALADSENMKKTRVIF